MLILTKLIIEVIQHSKIFAENINQLMDKISHILIHNTMISIGIRIDYHSTCHKLHSMLNKHLSDKNSLTQFHSSYL